MREYTNLYPPHYIPSREIRVCDVQQETSGDFKMSFYIETYFLTADAPKRYSNHQHETFTKGDKNEIWARIIAGAHQIDIINQSTFKRNKFGDSEH